MTITYDFKWYAIITIRNTTSILLTKSMNQKYVGYGKNRLGYATTYVIKKLNLFLAYTDIYEEFH